MSGPAAKTYEEQIHLLEERGMRIADRESALAALKHLNYYRLQLYSYPFRTEDKIHFGSGVTFEQVIGLYDFDQKLRGLALAATKVIEVSMRARFAYVVGHRLGPMAHLEKASYKRPRQATETLMKAAKEFERAKRIEGGDATGVTFDSAPVWAAVEAFSFGTTSRLYSNLKASRVRDEISATYGIGERSLSAALYNINVARNLAAHHARFWNTNISEKLLAPSRATTGLKDSFGDNIASAGCYNTLVMIVYLVGQINPRTNLPMLIRDHLATLPWSSAGSQASLPSGSPGRYGRTWTRHSRATRHKPTISMPESQGCRRMAKSQKRNPGCYTIAGMGEAGPGLTA